MHPKQKILAARMSLIEIVIPGSQTGLKNAFFS